MKGKRSVRKVLAWILVAAIFMSTCTNVWAIGSESETEAATVQEQTMISGETDTQESDATEEDRAETNAETAAGTESEIETTVEAASEPDQTANEETEEAEETESRRKATRAGNDVTADFEFNIGDVLFDSHDVFENPGVSGQQYAVLAFKFDWKAKDISANEYKEGDKIVFQLFVVGSSAQSLLLEAESFGKEIALWDENDNHLANGTIGYTLNTDKSALITYTIVFTKAIEGKNDIKGHVDASFRLDTRKVGEKITIEIDQENHGTITIVPQSGLIGHEKYPVVQKSSSSSSDNTLTWSISAGDRIGEGFGYYESAGTHTRTDSTNVIITDTLDEYQSFYDMGKGVVNILFKVRIYVPMTWGANVEDATRGNVLRSYDIYLNDLVTNGVIQVLSTEEQVLETPKSFALIYSDDGLARKFVLNLGAPGSTGITINDFLTPAQIAEYRAIIELELDLYENELALAQGLEDSKPWKGVGMLISDASKYSPLLIHDNTYYGGYYTTNTNNGKQYYDGTNASMIGSENMNVGTLRAYVDTLRFAKDYYSDGGAPLYALDTYVTAIVNTEKAREGTTLISNNWSYSGGSDYVEERVISKDQWIGTISARAEAKEMQILKADSLYYPNVEDGKWSNSMLINGAALENVSFEVYEKDNPEVMIDFVVKGNKYERDTAGAADSTKVIRTNSDGSIILSGLTVGTIYVIREIAGPEGYYTQEKVQEFTVNADEPVYYLMKNSIRGVETVKVDEDNPSITLSDVTFELYQKAGVDPDPESDLQITGFSKKTIRGEMYYVYDKQTVATELTTFADGALRIINLPAGNYYLKEVTPPEGYQRSDELYEFTLREDIPDPTDADYDAFTPIIELENITNRKISRSIEVTKVSSEKSSEGSAVYLADAVFALYSPLATEQLTAEELTDLLRERGITLDGANIPDLTITAPDGTTYYLADVKASGTDGKILWDELKQETYYVMEIQAPDGYVMGDARYQVTWDGETTKCELEVVNEKLMDLKIIKKWTDATGNQLNPDGSLIEKITLKLYGKAGSGEPYLVDVNKDGTIDNRDDIVLTPSADPDQNWVVTIEGLPKQDEAGNQIVYLIKDDGEKITYTGEDEIEFIFAGGSMNESANADGLYELEVSNTALGQIVINKEDEEGNALGGVTFKLEKDNDPDFVPRELKTPSKTENGEIAGQIIFDNLSAGNYTLTEIATVEGKQLLAKPIKITIPFSGNKDTNTAGIGIADGDDSNKLYFYHLTYTIQNKQVLEMPTSGGSFGRNNQIGIMLILVGGVCLLLYMKRKKTQELSI